MAGGGEFVKRFLKRSGRVKERPVYPMRQRFDPSTNSVKVMGKDGKPLSVVVFSQSVRISSCAALAHGPMAAKKPHISGRDPEKLFEIICQIGSGSYGSVHKVRRVAVVCVGGDCGCAVLALRRSGGGGGFRWRAREGRRGPQAGYDHAGQHTQNGQECCHQ